MEYKIVRSEGSRRYGEEEFNDIKSIEEEINQLISEGWIPIGGIAVRIGSSSGAYFLQAMTRDVGDINE